MVGNKSTGVSKMLLDSDHPENKHPTHIIFLSTCRLLSRLNQETALIGNTLISVTLCEVKERRDLSETKLSPKFYRSPE